MTQIPLHGQTIGWARYLTVWKSWLFLWSVRLRLVMGTQINVWWTPWTWAFEISLVLTWFMDRFPSEAPYCLFLGLTKGGLFPLHPSRSRVKRQDINLREHEGGLLHFPSSRHVLLFGPLNLYPFLQLYLNLPLWSKLRPWNSAWGMFAGLPQGPKRSIKQLHIKPFSPPHLLHYCYWCLSANGNWISHGNYSQIIMRNTCFMEFESISTSSLYFLVLFIAPSCWVFVTSIIYNLCLNYYSGSCPIMSLFFSRLNMATIILNRTVLTKSFLT